VLHSTPSKLISSPAPVMLHKPHKKSAFVGGGGVAGLADPVCWIEDGGSLK
jgi:hypothetical protein